MDNKKSSGYITLITEDGEIVGPFKGELIKLSWLKKTKMYFSKIFYNSIKK